MDKFKTVGEAIREQMQIHKKRGGATAAGKRFLMLPEGDGRFNLAANMYIVALEMLNEAVDTVEDLMWNVAVHASSPIGESDPQADKAVVRGWELLRAFGRLPDQREIKAKE